MTLHPDEVITVQRMADRIHTLIICMIRCFDFNDFDNAFCLCEIASDYSSELLKLLNERT